MKGTIYQGVGHVQLVDRSDPKPTSKDVVVKVIASGICGTDSTEYNVKNTGAVLPGQQFGHEFAGTIAEVGSDVTGISVGMRVTVKPLTATRAGRRNSCMIGGFSQYMLVEDAAVGYNIYPLPEELSFEAGALVEPFSVGMHGVNLAQPQPQERALILGAGPIGLSALAGMKALGVESVVVSDLSEFRLQKAKELGASAVHNPKAAPLHDFLQELYGDQNAAYGMIDVVIDSAGAGSALEAAVNVTRGGARMSIIALHKAPIAIHPMIIMMKELTIKGSMGYINEFDQVMAFIASGKANLVPIITHRYRLEEIDTALKMAGSVGEVGKVMIDMTA
jgi:2-desacetyl-2-hydroxyethyl bacteriochlorophyllide A dehydrogenase